MATHGHGTDAGLEAVLAAGDALAFEQDTQLRYLWVSDPRGWVNPDTIGATDAKVVADAREAQRVEDLKRDVMRTRRRARTVGAWPWTGRLGICEMAVAPVVDVRGRVVGVAGSVKSVRTESGGVAAEVAHELTNLLGVVSARAQLALDRVDDDRTRRDLEAVSHAAASGSDLARDLLGVARARSEGRASSLRQAARRVQELLDVMLPPDVELRIDLDERAPAVAAGDAAIEQILINLVLNARDAMPEGGTIVIATRAIEGAQASEHVRAQPATNASYACLTVTDSGTGMAPDVAARALDPFFTTKPAEAGTGLGLAITNGLAQRLGGAVAIDSTPGHGTTISVYLPVAHGEDD